MTGHNKALQKIEKSLWTTLSLPTEGAIEALRKAAQQLQQYLRSLQLQTEAEANHLFETYLHLFLGCQALLYEVQVAEEVLPVEFVCPSFTHPSWLQEMKNCLLQAVILYNTFIEEYFPFCFINILQNDCNKNLQVFIKQLQQTKALRVKFHARQYYLYQREGKQTFGVRAELLLQYLELKVRFFEIKQALSGGTTK